MKENIVTTTKYTIGTTALGSLGLSLFTVSSTAEKKAECFDERVVANSEIILNLPSATSEEKQWANALVKESEILRNTFKQTSGANPFTRGLKALVDHKDVKGPLDQAFACANKSSELKLLSSTEIPEEKKRLLKEFTEKHFSNVKAQSALENLDFGGWILKVFLF